MGAELVRLGYQDYRRSDAAVLRTLIGGPRSIASLAGIVGVSRQAARKFADGLERRGFVTVISDAIDARRLQVALTPEGERYAAAVVQVVGRLNREIERIAEPGQLRAAEALLQAVIDSDNPVGHRSK
jgi:DNA-binding MarR family transcriptional regulator